MSHRARIEEAQEADRAKPLKPASDIRKRRGFHKPWACECCHRRGAAVRHASHHQTCGRCLKDFRNLQAFAHALTLHQPALFGEGGRLHNRALSPLHVMFETLPPGLKKVVGEYMQRINTPADNSRDYEEQQELF